MTEQEKSKLVMKDWSDIKSHDSWKIFKIMAEFVEGFERLSRIGPCVSIFGSARTEPGNKYYEIAEELAYQLTQNKYGVITGGGPGIMEAGNKGANRGGGKSVGLTFDIMKIHMAYNKTSIIPGKIAPANKSILLTGSGAKLPLICAAFSFAP